VFICAGCALWAARRARPLSLLGRLPIIRALRRRCRHQSSGGVKARVAIPVLPSSDLDRTATFYAPTGFAIAGQHPGYLLLHNADVELHFSHPGGATLGECYIHVGDAQALHDHLHQHGIDGLGPIADQDYGLREFVLTDPDGNRVRFGSPTG
jgi:catechol 2,3-dioxygenase-like lactoylglutathione lyase family enzyme